MDLPITLDELRTVVVALETANQQELADRLKLVCLLIYVKVQRGHYVGITTDGSV